MAHPFASCNLPDPQAGSNTLPPCGSIISTIRRTTERGVKNSPPFDPSLLANSAKKYSYLSAARAQCVVLPRLDSQPLSAGSIHPC
jgi:hypothetical protein